MEEPYPGWNEAFEKQRRMSRQRRLEQGDEPLPDETWDKWKAEILEELNARSPK